MVDDSQAPVTVAHTSKRRTRRLGAAIVTSIASKVGSLLVFAIGMPIALHSIGQFRYAAFAATIASVSWISIATVGAGPALTRSMSLSHADGDHRNEAALFTNGLLITLLAALFGFLVVGGMVLLPDLSVVAGPAVKAYQSETRLCLIFLAACLPLTVAVGTVEVVNAAYQDQYITNLWALLLSAIALPALIFVRLSPSLITLALALYLPPLITKAGAFIQLCGFRRRYLRFHLKDVSRVVLLSLLLDGLVFTALSAGTYLNTQLAVWFAAQTGATAAAEMGVLMQIVVPIVSISSMITLPLWPALIEAKARQDYAWLKRATLMAMLASLSIAVVAGVLSCYGISMLANRWYGVPIHDAHAVNFGFSFFVGTLIVENCMLTLCIGLGVMQQATILFVARSVVGACLGPFVVAHYGVAGILWLGALCVLCGPLWLMLRIVLRNISPNVDPI